MVTLALCLVLAWAFYIGYYRGLVLQVYYTFSSILAFIIAAGAHKQLADFLYLWVPFANATQGSSTYYFNSQYLFDLDKVFYAGLAFLIVYLLVYAIMRFLGIFVHLARHFGPDTMMSKLISGGLSLLVTLISLQIVLTILATIPLALVQDSLHDSFLAHAILQYVPFTSSFLKELWIANISG